MLVIKDKFTGEYPKGKDDDAKAKRAIIKQFAEKDEYDGDSKAPTQKAAP